MDFFLINSGDGKDFLRVVYPYFKRNAYWCSVACRPTPHVGLNDQSRYIQINKTIRDEENRRQWKSFHEHLVANLYNARIHMSIIYMYVDERKLLINKFSRSTTPKTQHARCFTHLRKKNQ